MNISFTGINNTNLKTKTTTKPIILSSQNGSQIKLDSKIREVDLECELTDNEQGADLKDFYDAMYKSEVLCTNSDNPNFVHIKTIVIEEPISVRKLDSERSEMSVRKSIALSINDEPIKLSVPSNRNYLSLLSFIAHLTSKLSKQKNLAQEQKDMAQEMNDVTQDAGEHFIYDVI